MNSVFPGGTPPRDGKVELGSEQSSDVVLVPRLMGFYKVTYRYRPSPPRA
jgi:hypothetical protein